MFFQPVAKSQDGGLIGQTKKFVQLGKLPVKRRVKEGFFHGGVGQREPQMHKVDSQHGLYGKGRSASAAFWVVRRNECHKGSLRYDLLHLFLELTLAGFVEV